MNSLPKTWFDKGIALEVIRHCFQLGQQKIRIGSGFFTIRGWGLIRTQTLGKLVALLVGLEEPGSQRARKALVAEMMRDLRTGLDVDRRSSVADLVARIETGRFRLLDARALDHHAKIYLVDCQAAIIGSSNTTGKGLVEQIESGTLIVDRQQVSALVEQFDAYFAIALDLTQELLEVLKLWLELASPWDIYLKTMLALEDLQEIDTLYPKQPTSYQVDAIAQSLRQIRQHRGSLLIASTGLGKTIVAIHVALRLREAGEIDNILVVCPKAVRINWKKEMRAAGLPCEYFVRQSLDKPSPEQDRSLEDFEDIVWSIQHQHQRWLLIIDESHEFRNRYKLGYGNNRTEARRQERQAFQRLRQLHQAERLKVLLLTGSPYAKEVDNINNQLYLLPHTAPNRSLLSAPEFAERAWQVNDASESIDLPVVSQLTTPHVAKHYGQKEGESTYINFGEQKRYVPKVMLNSVEIPLPLELEVSSAIAEGYFDLDSPNPIYRETIQRQVRIAWASSLLALRATLEQVADTPRGKNSYKLGKLKFKKSQEERQQKLLPIISQIERINPNRDLKLQVLREILAEIKSQNQKVIIFCERRATVIYLKQTLKKLLPKLKIAVTVEQDDERSFHLKETKEVQRLINLFAPIANDTVEDIESERDVFICTDAHGVGVNMQDAAVAINYDIDWTPIGPIQRAGRILRFWHLPRTVNLYTFIPTLSDRNPFKGELARVMQRWHNLVERHGESRKLIDLAVLTEANRQAIDLPDLASPISIRRGELNFADLADVEISPYFKHTAKLQEHRGYAALIAEDIISAKTYSGANPAIYVLLQHKERYHGVIYDLKAKNVDEPDVAVLLDILECSPDTAIAAVPKNEIEQSSHTCIQAWCARRAISTQEVVRVCALYLKPISVGGDGVPSSDPMSSLWESVEK